MDTRTQSAPNRAYEDIEPDFQWERDERTTTLIVLLPGFRKEQLKVQVTSTPLVRIIGERPISENKWHRINKEFSIPSDCDPGANASEVTAKFERGRLYVTFPIVISEKASKPQETAKPPQEESRPQEAPEKPKEDKAEEIKANEVSEEKQTPQKDKELQKEEGEREEKKVRTGGEVESIAASKNDGENLGVQGLIKRTKTRVLDYTISLRPTYNYEDYKDALVELKKPRKLVNSILVILFVVVLGIYVKNAFRSLVGGISKFQE